MWAAVILKRKRKKRKRKKRKRWSVRSKRRRRNIEKLVPEIFIIRI